MNWRDILQFSRPSRSALTASIHLIQTELSMLCTKLIPLCKQDHLFNGTILELINCDVAVSLGCLHKHW